MFIVSEDRVSCNNIWICKKYFESVKGFRVAGNPHKQHREKEESHIKGRKTTQTDFLVTNFSTLLNMESM